jgi:hypothetical protein
VEGPRSERGADVGYATLIIDYEELSDIKAGLDYVATELSNVQYICDTIQTLIGRPTPDLGSAIELFDTSWNDNRKGLLDTTKEMSEAVAKVLEDWTSWDSSTAATLTDDGQSAPASGSGPV